MKCGSSGSQNHGRSKSKSKKNIKCYNCGKRGHFKNECKLFKKNGDFKGKCAELINAQGCVVENLSDGEVLCSEALTTAKSKKKFADIWLIDSRAMWHITSRREWFHQYEPVSKGLVYMDDNHALEIVDIGTIKIKMYDGIIHTIQGIRQVACLKNNLLSLGQLDDLGCKTRIEK